MEGLEQSYKYQPIIAKDEIRVLRLEPGAFAEPLIGSLLVRKIGYDEENPPAYNCVSYCWGPQEDFTSFACDGKALRITAVVDEMLRHLRKGARRRYLWIDAICINQANNQEKNQQVRFMGRVYALARKVRIWLGPATDEEMDAVYPLFSRSGWSDKVRQFMNITHCESSADNTTSSSPLIEDFFSRAWFTRRWVLQEVAVARVVIVHCGYRIVPWAQFHDSAIALLWIYSKERLEHQIYRCGTLTMRTLDTIAALDTSRHETLCDLERPSTDESTAWVRILDLLQAYHTANCEDERDRLYALYGLSLGTRLHDEKETELVTSCPVDYDIHFLGIYTNFASAAVKAGQFHKILEHTIEFGSLADQEESWPSWVPGWNTTRNMGDVGHHLAHSLRVSPFPPEIREFGNLWGFAREDLWREDNPDFKYVYGSKAPHLRGCIHPIGDTQSRTAQLDAIAYFETVLGRQCAGRNCVMSRYKVAWVMTLAIKFVPTMFSRTPLDLNEVFIERPTSFPKNTALWEAMKRVFGLQSNKYTEEQFDFDKDKVISKARWILKGLDAFCYEYNGSPTFGIAFAQVKPGDFVFRTTKAVNAKVKDGQHSPSAFALIIRPYHPASSNGPATFRFVGMCLDYYPDVKDPEIVDVVLV